MTIPSDATLKEVAEEMAQFSRGDIAENYAGHKFVVMDVMVSLTHNTIKYHIEWKHTNRRVVVPEQSLSKPEKVEEMDERPYCW